METSDREASPFDPAPDEPVAEVPSVVAVVVTSDPGERFDAALASLATQDYPSLTVLVVDAGSSADPSPRVAAVMPDAFVRRLPERVSFATAANEALAAVEGANFMLFCHDDVVLQPDALWLLVEEALRSNAGIVGPKFVDVERPTVLLQVGMSTDKFGVQHSGIEPGEIDHEQHDAVRDVLYVPAATILARADLCSELGGFDPDLEFGLEELDLCWRARLAGARVVVVPDAVVLRPADAVSGVAPGADPDVARRLEPRQRLFVLLRNYSFWSLARVLPQAVFMSAAQAGALLVTGRPRRAGSILAAWWWALRHLPSVLGDRRRIQRLRSVPDLDIRSLQIRGSATLSKFLAGHLDLGSSAATLGEAGRELAGTLSAGFRRVPVVVGAVLLLLALLGSRDLVTGSLPARGSFLAWPGLSDLAREFTSPWRFAGPGSASARRYS